MTYATKAGARITPLLDPGETIVAAARFQTKGANSGGGLAGVAIGAARASGAKKAAAEVGMTLPMRGVFVVTDRRAVILNSTLFGRPKSIVSTIPTQSVTGVELTGKGLAPALKRVRINFASGGGSELDVFRRDGVDEIVAALNGIAGH